MIRIERAVFYKVNHTGLWGDSEQEFVSQSDLHPEVESFWKAMWPDPSFGMKDGDIDISICGAHHSINQDWELIGQQFPSLETFCGIAGSNCVGVYPSQKAAENCVHTILSLCCTYFGRNIVDKWRLDESDRTLMVCVRSPE